MTVSLGGTTSLGVWRVVMVAIMFGTTTRVSVCLLTAHAPVGLGCILILRQALCPSTEFCRTVRSACIPLKAVSVTCCTLQWHLTLYHLQCFVNQCSLIFELWKSKRVSTCYRRSTIQPLQEFEERPLTEGCSRPIVCPYYLVVAQSSILNLFDLNRESLGAAEHIL